MKYTNAMLTIIAVCLLWLCAQGALPWRKTSPVPVQVVSWGAHEDVGVAINSPTRYGSPLRPNEPVAVRIVGSDSPLSPW